MIIVPSIILMFTGPEGKIDNVSSKGKSTAHSQSKTGITFVQPASIIKYPENTLIISFVKRMYKNKTKIKISKKNSYGFLSSDKIYKLNFALCRFSKYSNSLWWYFATHRNYLTDVLPDFFFWLWLSIVSLPIMT